MELRIFSNIHGDIRLPIGMAIGRSHCQSSTDAIGYNGEWKKAKQKSKALHFRLTMFPLKVFVPFWKLMDCVRGGGGGNQMPSWHQCSFFDCGFLAHLFPSSSHTFFVPIFLIVAIWKWFIRNMNKKCAISLQNAWLVSACLPLIMWICEKKHPAIE